MSSARDNRQRAQARARLEREMAARREAAQRKRQLQTRIGGGVAGVVVLGLVVWAIVAAVGGGDNTPTRTDASCSYPTETVLPTGAPTADPSASPDPSATVDPSATAEPPATLPEGVVDIGRPVANPPRTGFQVLTFDTNLGQIQVEMDLSKTPCTANSLNFLASNGFYNNTSCHRLVPDIFALQCGDPSGTGAGGANYTVADENLPADKLPAYHDGDVAMANTGSPDTNGTQFFFVYGTGPLQGQYTLFGHVIAGLDIVKQVAAGGDDGAYDTEGGAGGGKPLTPLTFNTVTVGPITDTSQAPPADTSTDTAAPTAAPTT